MAFSLDYFILVGPSNDPDRGKTISMNKLPLTFFFIPCLRDFEPVGIRLSLVFSMQGVSINPFVLSESEITALYIKAGETMK